MSHWSIEIETPSELSDWLSWLIAEKLDVAVEIQDDETLIPGPEADFCRVLVRTEQEPDATWVQLIQECLIEVGFSDASIRSRHDNDESWKLGWKAFFKPTEVAPGVIVRPPWSDQLKSKVDVIIDPGLAFGTGTHATTQLAAQLLVKQLEGQPSLKVLDQGCGSGILSLIAARLGHQVVGVEIDPMATRSAQENLPLNQFSQKDVTFISDDQVPNGPFDVVIANIIAPVLIDLASQIKAVCQETIILSGLLVAQEDRVLKAYQGWVTSERITSGEWVGLILKRVEAI
jgi:ribosomal protein L11 methyltransferase